jgi:small subunit ribosomal protein S2
MRAANLYATGIADSVLLGKESLPTLPVGEDDFVELDEEGRPTEQKPKRGGRKTRAAASVAAKADPSEKRASPAAEEAVADAEPAPAEVAAQAPVEGAAAVEAPAEEAAAGEAAAEEAAAGEAAAEEAADAAEEPKDAAQAKS